MFGDLTIVVVLVSMNLLKPSPNVTVCSTSPFNIFLRRILQSLNDLKNQFDGQTNSTVRLLKG